MAGERRCEEAAQMSWWAWIIGGAILLGAELAYVNAQFYLVFIGGAAIVVGVVTALAPELQVWAQWATFGVLAITSMVTFRSRIYRRFRGHPPPVRSGPAGDLITLRTNLAPGESCQTEHGGTFWTVRNDSDVSLPSGTRVRVASVQGLTLLVRPDA
jgi:membrane protein implicated in regulation of membrane protease activity